MGALSQPVSELVARLQYHAAPTRILEGFRVMPKPETAVEGRDDLPRVMLLRLNLTDDSQSQTTSFARILVALAISSRKEGDMTGHAQDVEKVLDAIEVGTDGKVDFEVGGSTIRGVRVAGEETEATGVGIQTIVTVTLETKPFNRGARRSTP